MEGLTWTNRKFGVLTKFTQRVKSHITQIRGTKFMI